MDLTVQHVSHPRLLAALTPQEQTSIERGDVVVRTHPEASRDRPVVLGLAALTVARENGWRLFVDWAYVNDFVPAVQMRAIERRAEGKVEYVSEEVQVKLALLRLHYVVNARFDSENYVQTWTLASKVQVTELMRAHPWLKPNSDLIRGIDGRISCSVYPGGRTLFAYEGLLTPAPLLPRVAEQFIARRSIHTLLTGFVGYFTEHPAGDAAPPGQLFRAASSRL
jgi:hypothetical protein